MTLIQAVVIASVVGEKVAVSCDMAMMSDNYATVDYTCTATNVNINYPNTSLIISTNKHPGQSFQGITSFQVSNQKVIYLPQIFNVLTNLRILKIKRSLQKYLLKDDFKSSNHLSELSLSYGEIEEINKDTFENTFALLYISIEHHRVVHIPSKLFENLAKLEYVSFRNNFLKTLSGSLFVKNEKIKSIFFDNNNITTIGRHLLQNQKQAEKISFLNNLCINKEFPKTSLTDLENTFHSQCKELSDEIFYKYQQNNDDLETQLTTKISELQFVKSDLQLCETNKNDCEFIKDNLNVEKLQSFDKYNVKLNEITLLQNEIVLVKSLRDNADDKYNKCTKDNEKKVQKVTDLALKYLELEENTTGQIHNLKLEIVSLKTNLKKINYGFKCFNEN